MIGCIAQKVGKVFPMLFSEKRGYKSLSYSDFGVLAVGAIKELKDEKDGEIDRLKKDRSIKTKKQEGRTFF